MKKLVIFDLDGTLLNTVEDIRVSLNYVLEKYGYKAVLSNELVSFLGYGARRLVELASKEEDQIKFEKVFSDYVEHQKNSTNEYTVLYDGLDNLLKTLKKDGYMLAIVSNKPDIVTQVVVQQKLGVYGFDFVTGNKPDKFKPKPDKSCLEYCLTTLGVDKKDAVFIGDSEVDVETYLGAGVDGIGVTWGFRTESALVRAGCKIICNTASELYSAIKNL